MIKWKHTHRHTINFSKANTENWRKDIAPFFFLSYNAGVVLMIDCKSLLSARDRLFFFYNGKAFFSALDMANVSDVIYQLPREIGREAGCVVGQDLEGSVGISYAVHGLGRSDH